ncbi:MAG: hypothetical protein IPP48_01380 [Chitinophagaceae bacterium]|nr:hypothetical protein [Chitinophagaceae bacterium]
MRKFLKASFLTAGLFFTVQIFAQDLIKGNPGMYPSYVAFKAAPPAFTNGKIILSDENGKLSNASNVLLKVKNKII